MKKFTMFACLAFVVVFALSSFAGELPRVTKGQSTLHGGNVNFQKAGLDTINLMSATLDPTNNTNPGPCSMPEPIYRGDFESGVEKGTVDTDGSGFTSLDITEPTVTHWNLSDIFGSTTGLRAWCGDATIVACVAPDTDGGYGNSWHDLLAFRAPVIDDGAPASVRVQASLHHDSEPGYDKSSVAYRYHGEFITNVVGAVWDGEGDKTVDVTVSYLPNQLMDGEDILVFFRFQSDGGWSDADCSFPSDGAAFFDDVTVTVSNDGQSDVVYTEDFDQGLDIFAPYDQNDPQWHVMFPDGVGDFARIWRGLEDDDRCRTNYTAQVAFIDDGEVIAGTGGSDCINWCYGPGGYIVNTTGGLAGEDAHLHNSIESPVMAWPAQAKDCVSPIPDGIIFNFDVYRHEDLTADAPGIFYTWGVRSADIDDADLDGETHIIEDEAWGDRNFVYYGGPDYTVGGDDVTDLMHAGRDEVQVQIAAYELGWAWYWTGNDGYPAPYLDNLRVKIFPYFGPGWSGRELDFFQDSFPERGDINMAQSLASHNIRFDSSNNISIASHLRNDPGDSMTLDIVPVRSGSAFTADPVMRFRVDANAVFDGGRSLPGYMTYADGFITGEISGRPAVGLSGTASPDRWAFDLPDSGFFFPGDVLHYYLWAEDNNGITTEASHIPVDTTGFSHGFGDPMGYNPTYTVRGLPGIRPDGFGGFEQPEILFINDFANRGGEDKWYTALNNIGLKVDDDYDVYYVNGPSSGVGNGIGGRAPAIMLADYMDILYTAGDLSVNTIANFDYQNDAGDDVGTLRDWFDSGGKDIFLTGDDLGTDLSQAGTATLAFLEQVMGVNFSVNNIRSFIDNQATPRVFASPAAPGNPVFSLATSWIAYGGCNVINTFDGLLTDASPGTRIAEFEDPNNVGYDYSAATLNIELFEGAKPMSRAISFPYDLMYVFTDPSAPGNPLAARTRVLWDILIYFGIPGDSNAATPVLPGIAFQTSNYPNPFNPSTTIKYSMPKAGHLNLNVYNVRGQLVKTLIDGTRPAGADQTIVWDGTNNQGSSVASGVYFYEARTGGDVKVQKMALVK